MSHSNPPTVHSPFLAAFLVLALAVVVPVAGQDEHPVQSEHTLSVGLMDPMAATDGEHIYLFGGSAEGTPSRDILRIDPETLEPENAGQLPSARLAGSAAYVQGKFYVFGGAESGTTATDTIIEYNPGTQQASTLTLARLPHLLINSAAASDGNKAYIFGGYKVDFIERSDRIIEFNPSSTLTQVRTLSSKLPAPVDSAAAAFDGTRFVIAGGQGDHGEVKDSIVRFDASSGAVTTASYTLPEGVRNAGMTAQDGVAHLFGGATRNDRSEGTTAIIEINATHAFSAPITLETARWSGGTALVDAHAYLVAGRPDANNYSRAVTRVDLARLGEPLPGDNESSDPGDEQEDHDDGHATDDDGIGRDSDTNDSAAGEASHDEHENDVSKAPDADTAGEATAATGERDASEELENKTVPAPAGILLPLVLALVFARRRRRVQ